LIAPHCCDQALLNFADGAIYWAWLGFLGGCIGMAANMIGLSNFGPAFAIAFLTVLYGYFIKWMIMAAVENNEA